MNKEEIKQDIESLEIFNDEELQSLDSPVCTTFKSWEFWQILHFTNAELYYLNGETSENLQTADEIHDTPKGRIYCFS